MIRKGKRFVVPFILLALALSGVAAFAAEQQESPAKAAARKRAEEKMRKQAGGAAAEAENPSYIDLNKASKEQLMSLPGVGEAEADKIIAARPFIAKAQLRQKNLVSAATFYEIVDKVGITVEKLNVTPKIAAPPPPQTAPEGKSEGKPKRDIFKDLGK